MKVKNYWLLMVALFANCGILLVDRFTVDVPDWLAIECLVIAFVATTIFALSNKKPKKQ